MPTAPSNPKSRPSSPAAHTGQLTGDTTHGGWRCTAHGGHLTGALATARELAHSRARGDRGTGVPVWCTHLHLLQAPWSLGHRAGDLEDRPGGRGSVQASGSSKHSLLLPLHGLHPPKGRGLARSLGGSSGLARPVLAAGLWGVPDVLGELAPGAGRWGEGRRGQGPPPREARASAGGRGACQPEATASTAAGGTSGRGIRATAHSQHTGPRCGIMGRDMIP